LVKGFGTGQRHTDRSGRRARTACPGEGRLSAVGGDARRGASLCQTAERCNQTFRCSPCRTGAAWARWLDEHDEQGEGVWLTLANKGTTEPTALTYDAALAEALCHGWIDGQLGRGDDGTFRRKFTPRKPGSAWSKRNVALATTLMEEGRMRPSGLAAVSKAKADGTWQAA
jgi:uncharacterized protein YdeI (YjbR/CyaY-like superfamily)